MRFCWFGVFWGAGATDEEVSGVSRVFGGVAGVSRAVIHTPARTHDPYLDDGAPPGLVLQVYFQEVSDMEGGLSPNGGMQGLVGVLGRFSEVTQQAMVVRGFPVPDPVFHGEGACTYLVSYEGPAANLNKWMWHYLQHHPPIMARFPGIREIEVASGMDWCGFLPWPRIAYMQRNKVVFDDQDGLTAALNSPVRHEMRGDFKGFPEFSGVNTHYPMNSRYLRF